MNFLTKIFLEVANLFFNNRIAFYFARRLRLFDAVFVMYPADYHFADYFTFRARQWLIRWKPFIVGVVNHPSGKRTLMFAISAFVDGKDGASEVVMLRLLHSRAEVIKERLGANSTHFAGTLPRRFTALKIRRGENQKNERRATQINVVNAVTWLRVKISHISENPVVILGSNGYIGKEVVAQLTELGIKVICVDKVGVSDSYEKPAMPHIVVNITTPEAINEYVDPRHMDGNTVLLNEVYPAPHDDVVKQMRDLEVKVFHIAGVCANAFPSFPSSYQGAIPCCAALYDEDYPIKVVEL